MNGSVCILVTAFQRPGALERCLRSLSACAGSADIPLVVSIDVPKSHGPRETRLTREVHQVAAQTGNFNNREVFLFESHQGLFHAVTGAISEVLSRYSSVIVLEDDILVAPTFLPHMLEALALLRHETSIASVSAWAPWGDSMADGPELIALQPTSSWAWATWQDRWPKLGLEFPTGSMLGSIDVHDFNVGGYPFWQLLEREDVDQPTSWAIRWYYHNFVRDKNTAYFRHPEATPGNAPGSNYVSRRRRTVDKLWRGGRRAIEARSPQGTTWNSPPRISFPEKAEARELLMYWGHQC
jgi:hypothetical protein